MKNIVKLISYSLLFFTSFMVKSQVLYNENFNSYALGNLGTDPTGTLAGKGGWLTQCSNTTATVSNNYFNITSESGKGNVLTLSAGATSPTNVGVIVKKVGIDSFVNQRASGNNVIKFEIDYYTGGQQKLTGNSQLITVGYDTSHNTYSPSKILFIYQFRPMTGEFYVFGPALGGNFKLDKNALTNLAVLPFNTWVSLIVYLDYNNKKAYFETPYFNTIASADFFKNSTSTNLIEDFKPTVLSMTFQSNNETITVDKVNKYDNVRITALKSVPAYVLNSENFLAQKFNLYPNPVTNVVNISNAENMVVEQVVIYDIAGKQLSTQTFNNETEIQLKVEHLASGTYLLHLQTNEGTAVKKLVKK